MSGLLSKVKKEIAAHGLIKEGDKVIVGLSGGADSVALAVALHRLGYDCIAAHCNFQLRGEESVRDENHARCIAESLEMEFRSIRFNVKEYVGNCRRPTSIEMACRELRYDWFEQLRKATGAEFIAVAHNADDNAETLLLNLFRGSGIAGLRGMLPINDKGVIRPLLHCRREEIEDFLDCERVRHVVDSTNLSTDFVRNKIRHNVLPALEREFPNVRKGIGRTIDNLRAANSFYQRMVAEKQREYLRANGDIELSRLIENEPDSKLLLFEWLSPLKVSDAQVADMLSAASSTGKRFPVSGRGTFYIDRGFLKFEPEISQDQNVEFCTVFSVTHHPAREFKPLGDRFTAYFDEHVLDQGTLRVRFWQVGDTIKPFGMKGTKKLSDIFSDNKIPSGIKSKIPLLVCDDTILWVPGLRASRCFKVTPATERFIEVRYVGKDFFQQ